MKKIKVGIIGTGFSANAHIEALRRIPGVEVVGIAGSCFEKAKKAAEGLHIRKVYETYTQLIRDNEIDVIHNCTPNFVHFEINKEVLLSGKHLLSEKPLAVNSKESDELKQLALESNALSAVCFNYRHYPLVIQAKEMIKNNDLGRIHVIHGGYLQDWLLYNHDFNWRLSSEKNGKSRAIADIGSHWCDTLQYILGKKIVKVLADLKTVHPVRLKSKTVTSTFSQADDLETEEIPINTEDYGSVLVHFEDGIQGVFTVSQVSAGRKNKLYFEIAGAETTIAWDQEEPNKMWVGKRGEPNRELVRDSCLLYTAASKMTHYPGGHQEGWSDGLKNLLIDFYSSIECGEKSQVDRDFATFEDGHRIMKIIEAILESHEKKTWVSIN